MHFLVVIIAFAALIWVGLLLRRCGVLPFALCTLGAGICFGAFFFQISLATMDRMMVGVLLFAYIVARRTQYFECKRLSIWDVFTGLFVLSVMCSTFTHDWRANSLQPVSRFLFYYLLPVLMYWMGRESTVTERSLRYTFMAVAYFGFYLAITSIAEWQQWQGFVFPSYVTSAQYLEFLGRGRGPLLNPSGNGILLCLGLGALLLLWPHSNKYGRIFVVWALFVFCGGIFGTLTRCVWLGGILCILFLILTTLSQKQKAVVLSAIAIVGTIVLFTNRDRLNRFKRDKNVSASQMAQSAELRPVLAQIAWEMFKDRPIVGFGYGQYKAEAAPYITHEFEIARPYVQHNIFLSILIETGLVGMSLFILMLLTWTRSAWMLWESNSAPLPMRQLGLLFNVVLLAYFANGMFQDVTIVPMVHMTLFFFGGLTMGQFLKYVQTSVGTTTPLSLNFADRTLAT